MLKLRAVCMPVLVLAAVCALAWLEADLSFIAHFGFIWDVLLGAALGAGLALLPPMSGFAVRRNAATSMYWVCGFVALLLVFYQYAALVTGVYVQPLAFLSLPGTRMRVVEGAVLAYCSVVAGRGKI